MSYISLSFYILVIAAGLVYHLVPAGSRWYVLLGASAVFYWLVSSSPLQLLMFGGTIVYSFLFGLLIERENNSGGSHDSVQNFVQDSGQNIIQNTGKPGAEERGSLRRRKAILTAGILGSAGFMILVRFYDLISGSVLRNVRTSWILPVGMSFYTLQIVAYLVDVYKGKTPAEKNFLRYALFISWFPQIIQGPIPRHEELRKDLYAGHPVTAERIAAAFRSCLWGFFLKMMIADKAGVYVDTVFGKSDAYPGLYLWTAAILASIQMYCDFEACVCISKGVSILFGITLPDNFRHPFRSLSTKELWGRWHMSFSRWLRDYIYFPLGGSRKGTKRKYLNLLATFLVSGLWHGGSFQFIAWGCMWVVFRLAGDYTESARDRMYGRLGILKNSKAYCEIKAAGVFLLFSLGMVIVKAQGLMDAVRIYLHMFSWWNPWIFTDGGLFRGGLDARDWNVLLVSVLLLAVTEHLSDTRPVRERLASQAPVIRVVIYFGAVVAIILFGTYGDNFAAQNFIYGGF